MTLVLVLVIFRKQIRVLLGRSRVSKASAFGVTLEFAMAKEVELDWRGPGGSDYRSSTVAVQITA